MLTTEVQEQVIQNTIPSLPAIGGKVVPWICEFYDLQWPQSQKGLVRDGKEAKKAYLIKGKIWNKLCLMTRQRNGVGKV